MDDAIARHPLLTLVGPAGVGKTRLALEAASRVRRRYSGGTWLVDFATVRPERIPHAVADALNLAEQRGEELVVTIASALAHRPPTLLILDNCDQLVQPTGELAGSIVRSGGPARIVVTSRRVFGTDEECLFPVSPLPEDASVELFIDRARRTAPNVVLTDSDAAAVTRICQQLDHLPLAIELAATQIRLLEPAELSKRLDDRFRLLSRPRVPTRHGSIAATVGWSYEQLHEPAKRVFERLSIFAGSCTLEAAEAVCADDGVNGGDVLGLIGDLVDRSMLVRERGPDGVARYRMLETLRLYGRELLESTGQLGRLCEAHATHYLALAQAAEPHLFGREESAWIARLRAEEPNLRLALDWARDHDVELARRFGVALWQYWNFSWRNEEAVAYLRSPIMSLSEIGPLLDAIFLTFPPLGAAIGIVRHGLLDVDRVVHRGILAAVFAAAAGALYGGTVLLAERLVGRGHDLGTSVVAVGVVAVAALPLWRTLNQGVERMLYGRRSEPFEVLARLGSELDAAATPEILFRRVTHSLAQSLRLPYVAIKIEGLEEVRAGEPQAEVTELALVHNGIRVGTLGLGHRSETEPFGTEERHLLDDLSRRLAATVHAIRLASDLQRSRESLVLAREEERRRIRHDLHDSLGPQLAGIGLQLDLAREDMKNDPVRLERLLTRAKDELSDAILDVRRVVDGLRPPALDELGLVGAIRQQVGLLDTSAVGGLRISVEATEHLGPLPAAVEVAAFRIATEAATNAVRHSGARTCTISLRRCDALEVEVSDDGQGMQDGLRNGVGLVSLRERAEELGGDVLVDSSPGRGTRVSASLPVA